MNVTETNTGKKWTFIAVDSVLRLGSLHPYYVYSFSLCARTIGNGPYSPPITVRTQEEGEMQGKLHADHAFVDNAPVASISSTSIPIIFSRNYVLVTDNCVPT